MKKIISLVMFFSLFCSVNVFAETAMLYHTEIAALIVSDTDSSDLNCSKYGLEEKYKQKYDYFKILDIVFNDLNYTKDEFIENNKQNLKNLKNKKGRIYSEDEFVEKYKQIYNCFKNESYSEMYNLLKFIIGKDSNKERINNSKIILASMYSLGLYVKQDYKKSFMMIDELLKEKDETHTSYSIALFIMGEMYFWGEGTNIDFNKSISFMNKSASLENNFAIHFLEDIEKDNITEDNLGEKIYGLKDLFLFSKKEIKRMEIRAPIKVFQVLQHNMALASVTMDTIHYKFVTVLIIGNEDDYFYDDQNIEIPINKKIKQVGIYKYITKKDELLKTIPAVVIK